MEHLYDVVIIGGGPSGLTAALYLARACYRVLVLEKENFGGQIRITNEVVNYPGIESTDGHTLTETMRKQASSFGAEFAIADATSLELEGDIKTVHTNKGDYKAFGILLATGARPRTVGFKGEEEYKGRGVAYCATCDGEFFTDKEVFVIGGGYAAAEESVFLTRYAKKLTILVRGDDFKCDKATAQHVKENDKIKVLTNTELVEVSGETFLNRIVYKNNKTGENFEYSSDDNIGVFVFAGFLPQTELVKDKLQLTDRGYIWTDRNQKTSIDGVYASGDVCDKPLRQVVTAVGDGALAATELEKYAAAMQKKMGIVPEAPKRESNVKKEQRASDKGADITSSSEIFTSDMLIQLNTVFDRMSSKLTLELCLDDRAISKELEAYMNELAGLTEKLSVVKNDTADVLRPCVRIIREDGSYSGHSFHGVPGGHEFTSFILGLYNIAGPGQALDETAKQAVLSLSEKRKIKILISLSCTMCPDLVVAAWRIAALNPNIEVATYDINHFGDLKDKYKVMSVPCMVIDDDKVSFGKKNIEQLTELLK